MTPIFFSTQHLDTLLLTAINWLTLQRENDVDSKIGKLRIHQYVSDLIKSFLLCDQFLIWTWQSRAQSAINQKPLYSAMQHLPKNPYAMIAQI